MQVVTLQDSEAVAAGKSHPIGKWARSECSSRTPFNLKRVEEGGSRQERRTRGILVSGGVLGRSEPRETCGALLLVFGAGAGVCSVVTGDGTQPVLKLFAQPAMCAEQPQADSYDRYAQAACDLLR